HASLYNRHLHSFPTRRSSDLRTGDLVQARQRDATSADICECGRHELTLDGGILGRADNMVVVRGVNVYPSAVEEIVRNCPGVAEDRKSTRLNSSHDQISYAVF